MLRAKEQDENEEPLGKISCTAEIRAAFILSSFVIFITGLMILFIFRLFWRVFRKWRTIKGTGIILELFTSGTIDSNPLRRLYFSDLFRDRIEMLLSAQTVVGQVLMILVFVLSIGSLIIYFINSTDPVRSCSSYQDKTIPFDLIINAFFSFYFGLRFLAADDKIKFWLEMNSIVDIFTIPPTFISYYLKSNWLGLRFLRALRLLELPQILQILQAIRTSHSVKFAKLLSIVLSTWFTAAGFIHLVENSGDPWLKIGNSQNISYFDSVYLVMATTSTVGFGDVVAKTSLGRTFIIFFTLGSLVLVANYIPEMLELLAKTRNYTGSYEVVKGKKYIVVCGNITVDSVTAFLRNFLRHNSGEINTEIVFLGETPPSLELETIFKCNLAYTTFICGSAMKWKDLKRVAVESAEACLILANPLCSDSHAEDTSNIMRVLSVKNYYPKTRIIIQILQSHNKVYLPKIPSWDWNMGDNIICFAELKLGFLAQGCLVPGLCTFLTSLFVEQNKKVIPKQTWEKQFLDGLKNKILTQRLSDDFAGMSFPDVSRGLMLNPPAQVRLRKNTLGFFIAESPKEVKRAFYYCVSCHSDLTNPELIVPCACRTKSWIHLTGAIKAIKSNIKENSSASAAQNHVIVKPLSMESWSSLASRTYLSDERENEQLDSSGMFHWCKAVALEKVILKRSGKSKLKFRNHIVACVFGDNHSALMGLRNFVMPLRASNYTRRELKDIVFIGSLDYMQKEWRFLRNFPQIYVMPGSALYPADLRVANIEYCSMCAILSPPSRPSSSKIQVDTETIMATLNIGSLRISTSAHTTTDRRSTIYTEDLMRPKYRRIPIITELKNPSNIHFIEQLGGLEGNLKENNLLLSTSFSAGTVFSGNFLDSLLATAFYNYHVLELLQMLVTGGISSQLEQHLDKEKFCDVTDSCSTFSSGRLRCRLGLLSLDQNILSSVKPRETFGQLFCGTLDNLGILCVGLYRMIEDEERNPENKRFVITRPANEFNLLPSDLVFCAIPFGMAFYEREDVSLSCQYEIIDTMPVLPELNTESSFAPTISSEKRSAAPPSYPPGNSLDPKTCFYSTFQQASPTQTSRLSPTESKLGGLTQAADKVQRQETLEDNVYEVQLDPLMFS